MDGLNINTSKIAMFWDEVPICGLITEQAINADQMTLYTKKLLHPEIFERFINKKNNIKYIKYFNEINEDDLDLYICAGWHDKEQLDFVKKISKKNKIIVLAVDNSFKRNLRQFMGMIYFRLFLKKYFRFAFVPGKSGTKLMRYFGFKSNEIINKLYGASDLIFNFKQPFNKRNKEFLFVGQLIDRKGITELIKGYDQYLFEGGSWKLRIIGDGPLKKIVSKNNNIIYQGKNQPLEIARFMNEAICLVAPSKVDHWATVVCEAAACGMILLVTKTVGASLDLLDNNGYILKNIKSTNIAKSMMSIENLSDMELNKMSEQSRNKASEFNQNSFQNAILKFRNFS